LGTFGKYFLEHQLRPKEFSPKPKENVIIKQRKTEKRNCCLIKVVD